MEKKRTAVYVDGYNLYYGRLRATAFKWLDLPELFDLMVNANEDFDHPNPALPDGSELKRMCLYRLSRERWLGYPPASCAVRKATVRDQASWAAAAS